MSYVMLNEAPFRIFRVAFSLVVWSNMSEIACDIGLLRYCIGKTRSFPKGILKWNKLAHSVSKVVLISRTKPTVARRWFRK